MQIINYSKIDDLCCNNFHTAQKYRYFRLYLPTKCCFSLLAILLTYRVLAGKYISNNILSVLLIIQLAHHLYKTTTQRTILLQQFISNSFIYCLSFPCINNNIYYITRQYILCKKLKYFYLITTKHQTLIWCQKYLILIINQPDLSKPKELFVL